jgi:hypothetical protein
MKFMKTFLYKTYYFWLFTKLYLLVGLVSLFFSQFSKMKYFRLLDWSIFTIITIYFILLLFTLFSAIMGASQNKWARYIIGVISLGFGFYLIPKYLQFGGSMPWSAKFIAGIVILLGIFELLALERKIRFRIITKNDIKVFYSKTHYFWVVTKIVLLVSAGLFFYFGNFEIKRFEPKEWCTFIIFIIYGILMSINLLLELTNTSPFKWSKYLTGIISLVSGIFLILILLKVDHQYFWTIMTFAIWVVVMGIFDLLKIQKNFNLLVKTKKIILYTVFSTTLIVLCTYNIFVHTDLFVPKQEEVKNSDQLFLEVLSEVGKMEKTQDILFFSFGGPSNVALCGNNFEDFPTPYETKMLQIKKNKEHPYIIDEEKLKDRFDDKTMPLQYNKVMLGRVSGIDTNCAAGYAFKCQNSSFCLEKGKRESAIYVFTFDSIKKKEVTINLYTLSAYNRYSSYPYSEFKLILEKGKWRRKDL